MGHFERLRKYDPGEPRDASGKWAGSGVAKPFEMSASEEATLERYAQGHSYNINKHLRDPKASRAAAKENFGKRAGEYVKNIEKTAKTMDGLIAKSVLAHPATLYRGVSDFGHIQKAIEGLKPGDTFSLPTFSSTSRSQAWAADFKASKDKSDKSGLLVISAEAGAHGLETHKLARFGKQEQEVLLGRNTPFVFDSYDAGTSTVHLTLKSGS